MIQLREPSPGLLSGSTTPRLRGAPAPYLVKSDSLRRRCRGLRVDVCGSSSSVGSRVEPGDLRTKLPRRDGVFECGVEDGGVVTAVGVVDPEGSAESATFVAGVGGGGRGPGGESVRDGEKGRGCSCGRVRWCRWLS